LVAVGSGVLVGVGVAVLGTRQKLRLPEVGRGRGDVDEVLG